MQKDNKIDPVSSDQENSGPDSNVDRRRLLLAGAGAVVAFFSDAYELALEYLEDFIDGSDDAL